MMDGTFKTYAQVKVCEKCGSHFGCGAKNDYACWCSEVALTPDILAYLRENYGNCLCPTCLKKYAEELTRGAG